MHRYTAGTSASVTSEGDPGSGRGTHDDFVRLQQGAARRDISAEPRARRHRRPRRGPAMLLLLLLVCVTAVAILLTGM
jgi:hypothetical protein